jgi:hypothetical protein
MEEALEAVTVASLAKDKLLDAGEAARLYPLEEDLNGYLDGSVRHAKETYLTYFMAAFGGPLEKDVIDFLCGVAGVEPAPGMRLVSGDEFTEPGKLTIDLVIATWSGDRWVPHVAVEAKFNAAVNGHRSYCRFIEKGTAYSNQAICYLHGCLHKDLHEDTVRFVWLGKPNRRPALGRWGVKGLHERDLERHPDYYGGALELQRNAESRWHFATWDKLEEKIAAAVPGPNGAAVVRALHAGW